MKNPKSRLSRRNFLLAVGTGSAAAAAALVAHKNPDAKAGKQAGAPEAKGYRLTEHIQNYYRTAKV